MIKEMGMRKRKPIICCKDSEEAKMFKYKNCFVGWALNIPIDFMTDLNREQFNGLLDGKYSGQQIERFERYGMF